MTAGRFLCVGLYRYAGVTVGSVGRADRFNESPINNLVAAGCHFKYLRRGVPSQFIPATIFGLMPDFLKVRVL
jgi:hypothetical protein